MTTVGLRDRLFRLAELELRGAARRLRGTAESLFSSPRPRVEPEIEPEPPPYSAEKPSPRRGEFAEIRRYYANLELPFGATADEVKAAYRRLMRRYHPDRHATDPARAEVANQVAQELRTAYEALLAYLGASRGSR